MYVPSFNTLDDPAEIDTLIGSAGAGDLVTVGEDGLPYATRLPLIWQRDRSRIVVHLARANPHWSTIVDGSPALVVVSGPQAYISPSWYAAKAEHGRVVPTWNYSRVELRGTAYVHDDPRWLREAVTELTDLHEQRRREPWAVSDAPDPFVAGQLRGIVGVEVRVTSIEGKAKLSQNRSEADRTGVVAGLRESDRADDQAVADAMDSNAEDSDTMDTRA